MFRKFNTDRNGEAWSGAIKKAVWEKAIEIPTESPHNFRKDILGNIIQYASFGNRNSEYGWEINHIVPISKEGGDNIDNLQPLHWQNNFRIGDD